MEWWGRVVWTGCGCDGMGWVEQGGVWCGVALGVKHLWCWRS